MDPEIRIVCIAEALGRYGSGALSCLEAAEVLGMSERHFRRLRDRYEAEGAAGLVDRRLGRASGRRAPLDQIEWVLEQYRTRYWDFTAKHFHEHLVRDHGFRLGYTWTKIRLQEAGLVKKARGRGAHRKRRPRRALPGMLLFQAARPTAGWWIWAATSTSSPPWTTPRARSSRPSWSRKKADCAT